MPIALTQADLDRSALNSGLSYGEAWRNYQRHGYDLSQVLVPAGVRWDTDSWIQTFTGRKFYPLAPEPEMLDVRDIAHALAMQCRYNGHVKTFYSVAEHCVLMARWFIDAPKHLWERERLHWARWAILHDAAEAYIGDMVRPLKRSMPDFVGVEDRILRTLEVGFDLPRSSGIPSVVNSADARILLDERSALLGTPPGPWEIDDLTPLGVTIHGWDPATAEANYLEVLDELELRVGA